MSRKRSREVAMELVYQQIIVKESAEAVFENFVELNEDNNGLELDYIKKALLTIEQNNNEIEEKIKNNLSNNWKLERLPKINIAILKLAISEIMYAEDIPNKVAINEGIELAKKYSDYKSVSFVNGMLDKISKSL